MGAGLALASIATQPSPAQAARPTVAEVEAASLPSGLDATVVRTDTLTSSEPDYDELDPLDESMTNPDIDTP